MKGESQIMKIFITALALFLVPSIISPAFALEAPRPESIAEKMSFKLIRGVANLTTAIAELPKQTYITSRIHGPIGYVVGPVKGVGMVLYRSFIGLTETIFFMVPHPGYYDPMIDPEFVWEGWDEIRPDLSGNTNQTSEAPGVAVDGKSSTQ